MQAETWMRDAKFGRGMFRRRAPMRWAAAGVALLLLGCGDGGGGPGGAMDGVDFTLSPQYYCEPTTNAAAGAEPPLFADPTSIDPDAYFDALIATNYRRFHRAPGYATRQPVQGVHGRGIEVYISGNAAKLYCDAAAPVTRFPDGGLIVKDIYTVNDEFVAIAAMERYADGWYFSEYRPDGERLAASFNRDSCQECHDPARNDGILAFQLPPPTLFESE